MQGYILSKTDTLKKEVNSEYYVVFKAEDLEYIAEALENDYNYIIEVEYNQKDIVEQDYCLVDSIIFYKVRDIEVIAVKGIKDRD